MGITLGLLGGGGSILAVPILRYVVGFEAKQAIALSLGVVGITSAIGAVRYWRSGLARLPVAIAFGTFSMVASYGGAKLAQFLTGSLQLLIFSVIMLAAAGSMWRERREDTHTDGAPGSYGPMALLLMGGAGLGVGLLTGLVGIGGGFMILPALVVLLRLPMRVAAGTSLMVIAMNAAAGVIGYAGHVEIPWAFLTGFTAAGIGGIIAGTYLAHQIPPRHLRRGFAVLVLVMALFMLFANRNALARERAMGIDEKLGIAAMTPSAPDRSRHREPKAPLRSKLPHPFPMPPSAP